ncbi:SDR family oxidoreductase [Spirillospora sp. CA-294931]|uniref:SDR family oxidoreductase n=1 Tax=Spirillospora sp. CA-294931 TaxID=3240042 RepID=UPI003D8C40EC
MADLTGKTALVTGASRGIGRAIAQRLAADGAEVAVHYANNQTAAEQTHAEITNSGGRAFLIRADLSAQDGLDTLFTHLEDRRLDIVVNNAAVLKETAGEITPTEFDRVFSVNVRAPFFLIQRALPLMPDGGRIINISSAVTRIALRDITYTMTKGALDAMGRVLANQLGARNITVNTVAPGLTRTDLTEWLDDPEITAAVERATALGRIGDPADIADTVAFLASHDARWITAHVLDATGGLWLGPRAPGNPWLALAELPALHPNQQPGE